MRTIALVFLLAAACGDNIKVAPPPDAKIYHRPDAPDHRPDEPHPPEPGGIDPGPGTEPPVMVDASVDASSCDDEMDTECHMHNGHWHCDPSGHDHNGKWHQGHL